MTKHEIEAAATKPAPCKICTAGIPHELRDCPQWLSWAYERRQQRWTKVPYQPGKGPAATDDPATWSNFDRVASYVKPNGDMAGKIFSGIGFVFSESDPFCGIDLDDALVPETKHLKPWAKRIVDLLNSYSEISPSGTGLKVWIKARKSSYARCRTKHGDGEVEFYDRGRYFAVTGQRWPGTPATIEERQPELDALYRQLFGSQDAKKTPGKRASAAQPETGSLADDELIAKAAAARNGDKFTRLFAGDSSDYDGDESRADMALCTMLAFWCDRDAAQMDRLFRRSGLMRPKWDERRGGHPYGVRTLKEACGLVHEGFRGNRRHAKDGGCSANGHSRKAAVVLDEADDDPHRLANGFLQQFQQDEMLTLRHWREEFQRWDGRSYRPVPDQQIRAELTQYVRSEFERLCRESRGNGKRPTTVRKVSIKLIADVLQALRGICCLPFDVEPPAWLNGPGPFPASEVLVSTNGILHLPSWGDAAPALHPLSPRLFSPTALDYPFDAAAPPPTNWLHFLNLLWPDDPQTIAALQEWFGYCLLPDTRQKKILMLVGPKRSGKGTIARVLSHLIGLQNVASPTLGSLGLPFGLQSLLHKTLAIISDARLSHRTDSAAVIERLLSISGEDSQTVDRKFRESVTLRLPTRFMVLTNELPRFHDAAGALVGRLILLRMTRSFYGREDTALTATLLRELPGILLWAINAWKRLRQRGHFLTPDSSRNILQQMDELASPIGAFVRERCQVGPASATQCDQLYAAWKGWAEAKGMKPGTEQSFGRDLRAAVPGLDTRHQRCGDIRRRIYTGIGLSQEEQAQNRTP